MGLPGVKKKLVALLTAPGLEEVQAAVQGGKSGGALGRVTLIGDAAHSMNPVWGLGANTALAGAACLIDTLRDELKQKLELTLNSFDEEFNSSDKTQRNMKKKAHQSTISSIDWKKIIAVYETK